MTDVPLAPSPRKHGKHTGYNIYHYLLSRPSHSATTLAIYQNFKSNNIHPADPKLINKALTNGTYRGYFVLESVIRTGRTLTPRNLYRIATLAEYKGFQANRDRQDKDRKPVRAKPAAAKIVAAEPAAADKAPRPIKPSSYTQAIYDVLDASGKPITLSDIWKDLPAALAVTKKRPTKKALKKLMYGGVHAGYFMRGANDTYVIADALTFKDRQKHMKDMNVKSRERREAEGAKPVEAVKPEKKRERAIINREDIGGQPAGPMGDTQKMMLAELQGIERHTRFLEPKKSSTELLLIGTGVALAGVVVGWAITYLSM